MSRADADELLLPNGRVRNHELLYLARSGQLLALELRRPASALSPGLSRQSQQNAIGDLAGLRQIQARVGRRRLPRSASAFQLFPNDFTKYRFNRTFPLLHRTAERFVHERLVVSTTGSVYLLAEPLKDIVVNTNRDSGLTRRRGDHRTTLGLAKIVLFLHGYFPSG